MVQERNPMIDWRTGQLRWADIVAQQHQKNPKEAKFRDDSVDGQVSMEADERGVKTVTKKRQAVLTEKASQPEIRHKQNRSAKQRIRKANRSH